MSTCCVSGCKYRYTPGSNIKLYRIPSGSRPYHANRRRLWLKAIKRANGSTEPIKDTARICSAHFISGESSMDFDSPDFVPSVFTCAERSQTPPKKVKWFYGRRKRRRRTAKLGTEEKSTPPEADSPVDLQSFVPMETESELSMERQTLSSPSVSKEEETLTEEAESETKAIQSQTSNTDMTSPSIKVPAGFAKLLLKSPIVLLKPIVSPAGGYQCEQCNLTFPSASQLVEHKQLHEEQKSSICEVDAMCFTSQADLTEHHAVSKEEPSFPCNICDRSFPTSQILKRHKLLHVQDGRKCLTCGTLFCRRHNHFLSLPKIECKRDSEEESSVIEPQHVGSDLIPENDPPNNPEPSQTTEESVPDKCSPVPSVIEPQHVGSDLISENDPPNNPEPSQTTEESVPDKCSPVPDNTQSSEPFTLLLTSSTSTVAATPPIPELLPKTWEVPHLHLPAPHTRILPKIPKLVLVKSTSMPPQPPAIIRYKKQSTRFQHRSPMPDCPAIFDQLQSKELPPSLKIFSPEYLTSALLEVKRNYEYIFSKTKDLTTRPIAKEEQTEPLMVSKNEQSVNPDKNERTAYDLEIIL